MIIYFYFSLLINILVIFNCSETTINLAIEKALQTAKTQNITGKEITPFLLSAITEITAGRSLDTSLLFFFLFVL